MLQKVPCTNTGYFPNSLNEGIPVKGVISLEADDVAAARGRVYSFFSSFPFFLPRLFPTLDGVHAKDLTPPTSRCRFSPLKP